MDHIAKIRQLFLELLGNQNETVFVPIGRITEIVGEHYLDCLDELGYEFEIEEKSSWPSCLGNTVGFYIA
jgi:hypothetical protein